MRLQIDDDNLTAAIFGFATLDNLAILVSFYRLKNLASAR
jgi:hypothetical protein